MAEQYGDKRHEPTPHRRQTAREEGQVAHSNDLAAAVMLVGALVVLLFFGGDAARFLADYTQRQLSEQTWHELDSDSILREWYVVIFKLARHVLPALGLIMLIGVLVNLGQVGFLWLPGKAAMDLQRLNPVSGLQRLMSAQNAIRLGFGIFKILLVGTVAYWCLWDERDELLLATELDLGRLAAYLVEITLWTCIKVGSALLLLAILDYGYQWWKLEQDLRMTTEELREEMKQQQGDPQILARRKAAQRQITLQRIRSAVPKAEVVVTNPTELAIAIQYDPETMDAPIVSAKGAGSVAQRIRQIALEHGVPILERKELARYLYKNVDIGQPVPSEQYAAMAEVLRYVYQLKGKTLANIKRAA
jgi:flagellar biosynthetic protein FlhB